MDFTENFGEHFQFSY